MLKCGSSIHPDFQLDTGIEIFFSLPKRLPKVPKPQISQNFSMSKICPENF